MFRKPHGIESKAICNFALLQDFLEFIDLRSSLGTGGQMK